MDLNIFFLHRQLGLQINHIESFKANTITKIKTAFSFHVFICIVRLIPSDILLDDLSYETSSRFIRDGSVSFFQFLQVRPGKLYQTEKHLTEAEDYFFLYQLVQDNMTKQVTMISILS